MNDLSEVTEHKLRTSKRREYDRKYRRKNRVRCNEVHRAYYRRNRKRLIQKVVEWRKKNPEKHYANQRRAYARARERVLKAYGGKCECCGVTDKEFLCVDHRFGGGNKHRKKVAPGWTLYLWLKRKGFPKKDFRLLCHNCNFSLGHWGYCPHKRISQPG